MTKDERWKHIEILSDLRAKYSCFDDSEEPYYRALSAGIKALKQEPRWIPVGERLPEKQDCYLVTTKWKGNYSGDVYIETNMAVYREKQKEWDCVDVIAWMPLPEPYKEEKEE